MTVIERFLKYVSFDTQSDENSGATPSTPKQMVFAQYLRSELEQLGFQEISLDENGYLFATWPANTDKPVPTIKFMCTQAYFFIRIKSHTNFSMLDFRMFFQIYHSFDTQSDENSGAKIGRAHV